MYNILYNCINRLKDIHIIHLSRTMPTPLKIVKCTKIIENHLIIYTMCIKYYTHYVQNIVLSKYICIQYNAICNYLINNKFFFAILQFCTFAPFSQNLQTRGYY